MARTRAGTTKRHTTNQQTKALRGNRRDNTRGKATASGRSNSRGRSKSGGKGVPRPETNSNRTAGSRCHDTHAESGPEVGSGQDKTTSACRSTRADQQSPPSACRECVLQSTCTIVLLRALRPALPYWRSNTALVKPIAAAVPWISSSHTSGLTPVRWLDYAPEDSLVPLGIEITANSKYNDKSVTHFNKPF